MEITIKPASANPQVAVLEPRGRIDTHTYRHVTEWADRVVDSGCVCVVMDLSQVEYISSSGALALQTIAARLVQEGGALKLARLRPGVAEALQLIGFQRIVEMYDTVEEAVASFSAAGEGEK